MNLDDETREALERYREAREAFDYIRMIPTLNQTCHWNQVLGKADSRQMARARELASIMIRKIPPT